MNELGITTVHQVFQDELTPGESLLWCGQPSTSVIFHLSDWTAIPISILCGGFAILFEIDALNVSGHFVALWGVPFVLIGQYMIWGRFLYLAWRKRRTFYGLTDKRVIVINLGMRRRITDGYLNALPSVTFFERSDKIGTIDFGRDFSLRSLLSPLGDRRGRNQLNIDLTSLTFFDLVDARSVYQMIQSQRERSK